MPKGTRKQEGCTSEQESERDAQVNKKARGMYKRTRKQEGCPSEQESKSDAQAKVALL